MPFLRSFRLSTYLTLASACLCLGYAEGDLLPETPYITGFVLVLIAVAYRLEGRWALSLQAANMAGATLAVVLVGWFALRKSDGLIEGLPFPANLLPYLGPVLMLLIPAKLFRPKHVGDYWAMHGIGLLAATLGCAMANDVLFSFFLVAYMVCLVWALTVFYLYREVLSRGEPPESRSSERPARRLYLLRVTSRWSIVVVGVGMLLFLITPRPADRKWELSMAGRPRMETGLPKGSLDLNKTGTLEVNHEIAFEVMAEDAEGTPKLDLDLNQRWRAESISHYENGIWHRERNSGLILLDKTREPVRIAEPLIRDRRALRNARLPDFGPNAYYLAYSMRRDTSHSKILADPVYWRAGSSAPVVIYGIRSLKAVQGQDGSFEWAAHAGLGRENYCQVAVSMPDADVGPPLRVSLSYQDIHHDFLMRISNRGLATRLRQWTTDLIESFVREGTLDEAVLRERDVPFNPRFAHPRHHEAIARAFENYLARSGQLAYTLKLQRKDKSVDPVEDFLFNTNAGHCEWFASALAMMLRSQRIPAQIVVGFRGCESLGDGRYVVRQSNAHIWVEALISRSPPANVLPSPVALDVPNPPMTRAMHWLSLDPTPSGEPTNPNDGSFVGWLEDTRAKGETLFKNYVLGYDAQARARAVESFQSRLEDFKDSVLEGEISWPFAIVGGVPAIVLGWFGIRYLRRHRRRDRKDELTRQEAEQLAPFHARLLDILARHGYAPRPGQTAREFTKEVAASLRDDPETAHVADAPVRLADAYYRVRFGGEILAEVERSDLESALNDLENILASKG